MPPTDLANPERQHDSKPSRHQTLARPHRLASGGRVSATPRVVETLSLILERLRLACPEDLFAVTQERCSHVCSDTLGGTLLWAAVLGIRSQLPRPPLEAPTDRRPLPSMGGPALFSMPPSAREREGPRPPELHRRADDTLACVRPDKLAVRFSPLGELRVCDVSGLATGRFATIILRNLRTGQATTAETRAAGTFCARLGADRGDPVLMRVLDWSHPTEDGFHERSLVMEAGRDREPMLVENPALGCRGPQELHLGLVSLERAGRRLYGRAAATPGTILELKTARGLGHQVTTVVGPGGSFSMFLDPPAGANDVLELAGHNACGLGRSSKWQAEAGFSVRLKVTPTGELTIEHRCGAVTQDGRPVAPIDNVDRTTSSIPSGAVRTQIHVARLSFSEHMQAHSMSASLSLRMDRPHAAVVAYYDAACAEAVFRVGNGLVPPNSGNECAALGGWRQELGPLTAIGSGAGFGLDPANGRSSRELSVAIGAALLARRPLEVRFEYPDGTIFARGAMAVSVRAIFGQERFVEAIVAGSNLLLVDP